MALFTPLFRLLIVLSRSAVIYQALNVPPVFTISAMIFFQSHLRSSTPCHDCQLFCLRKTRGPIDTSFHFWFRISCYLIGIDDYRWKLKERDNKRVRTRQKGNLPGPNRTFEHGHSQIFCLSWLKFYTSLSFDTQQISVCLILSGSKKTTSPIRYYNKMKRSIEKESERVCANLNCLNISSPSSN